MKLPPVPPTTIGGSIDYVSIEFSVSKGIDGVTRGKYIFSTDRYTLL